LPEPVSHRAPVGVDVGAMTSVPAQAPDVRGVLIRRVCTTQVRVEPRDRLFRDGLYCSCGVKLLHRCLLCFLSAPT
jgi:hypothetical protein